MHCFGANEAEKLNMKTDKPNTKNTQILSILVNNLLI